MPCCGQSAQKLTKLLHGGHQGYLCEGRVSAHMQVLFHDNYWAALLIYPRTSDLLGATSFCFLTCSLLLLLDM